MASTSINRTPASAGDMKKWTWSAWVKRGTLGVTQTIYSAYHSSNYNGYIRFNSSDTLEMYDYETVQRYLLTTTRKFRDTGAWYHIVINQDVENVTEGERLKMWINGVRETVFTNEDYPATTVTSRINNATPTSIGAFNSSQYFTGEMSHVQFVNAESLAPTEFGEFDSTSGIWKIKTDAYATPGTNGYFLKMEDRTNLDLDSSSNAYTWTTSGTLTATYDNPSDNFCIWSRLNPQAYPWYMSNGNTTAQTAVDSTWRSVFGTLANSTGKYYFESECDVDGGAASVGILATEQQSPTNSQFSDLSLGYAYHYSGDKRNDGNSTSYGDSYTDGDIIGIAYDATNGTLWFSKNGTWQNSATIGEIAAGTTTNAAFSGMTTGASKFYGPALTGYTSAIWKTNFGNGYFGTTAISSEGTNASGIGSFEYDVPTGFTAWSTKGFNE